MGLELNVSHRNVMVRKKKRWGERCLNTSPGGITGVAGGCSRHKKKPGAEIELERIKKGAVNQRSAFI